MGSDPDNDLAVIKISVPREKLTIIPTGDSSRLLVGQKVLAIGNPFGLGQTLTTGIVVGMNGKEVGSADELIRMIRDRRPGDKIELQVLRGDKFLNVKVILTERPRGQ